MISAAKIEGKIVNIHNILIRQFVENYILGVFGYFSTACSLYHYIGIVENLLIEFFSCKNFLSGKNAVELLTICNIL